MISEKWTNNIQGESEKKYNQMSNFYETLVCFVKVTKGVLS